MRRRVRALAGRTAIVTGAAGGIGRALCVRLAAEGCHLALVDLDEEGLRVTAALVEASGHRITRHAFDLVRAGALEALAAEVRATHGAAHLLFNNAGVTVHGALAEQHPDEIDHLVALNLLVPIHACRIFVPLLRESGGGQIVNISSLAALIGIPFQSSYGASKAALRAFSEALRIELAPLGIGVTAVLPGTIGTAFLRHARSHDLAASTRMAELMLRYGTAPDAVARRVVRAVRNDRREVRVGADAHLVAWLQRLAPGLLHHLLRAAYARFVVDGRLRRGQPRS